MAFVASSNSPGAVDTSVDVPVPTGAASGHIAVVYLALQNDDTINPPDGTWTLEEDLMLGSASADNRLTVFWKRLTGADTGDWTFTWATSGFVEGAAGLWSGRVAAGSPWGDTSTAEQFGTNVLTMPSVALEQGDDLVGCASVFANADWNTPTNMTVAQDLATSMLAYQDDLDAGSTGTKNFVATGGATMHGFMGALLEAEDATAGDVETAASAQTSTASGQVSTSGAAATTGSGQAGSVSATVRTTGVVASSSSGQSSAVVGGLTLTGVGATQVAAQVSALEANVESEKSDPSFNAAAFREAIHFAMHMGLPPNPDERITFYFAPTVTNPGSVPVDGAGVPFNPADSLTSTSAASVKVDCAVEYLDAEGQPTSFGLLTPSRVAVTLLDVDWEDVKDAAYVVIHGDRYNYRRTEPPQGLFDVGLYVMHFTAENET